jgi:signal peptidase I
LGYGREGVLFLIAPSLACVASIVLFVVAPTATFMGAVIFVAVALALTLLLYIVTVSRTWRRSRLRASNLAWWSQWYGLVLAGLLGSIFANIAVVGCHSFYKPFYLPSEAMAPTLSRFDRITADMHGGRHPAIGDIILFGPQRAYVKRVAAVAGDRISMKGGVPIVNGQPALQSDKGMTRFLGYNGEEGAHLIREHLPREIGSHFILDLGWSPVDDFPAVVVPPGHVFVLGDNRDRSADSRVPIAEGGSGMVPLTEIIGRPLFIQWSQDHGKVGQLIK